MTDWRRRGGIMTGWGSVMTDWRRRRGIMTRRRNIMSTMTVWGAGGSACKLLFIRLAIAVGIFFICVFDALSELGLCYCLG